MEAGTLPASQRARDDELVDRLLSQLSYGVLVSNYRVPQSRQNWTFRELLLDGRPVSRDLLTALQQGGCDFSEVESLEYIIAGNGNDPTEDDINFTAVLRAKQGTVTTSPAPSSGDEQEAVQIKLGPQIPPRTSSKRHASAQLSIFLRSEKSMKDLKIREVSVQDLQDNAAFLKTKRRRLLANPVKAAPMHSRHFWEAQADVRDIDVQQSQIRAQVSFENFSGSHEEFFKSEEFQNLQTQAIEAADERDLMMVHAEHIDSHTGAPPAFKRSWVTQFLLKQLQFREHVEAGFGRKHHDATEKVRPQVYKKYAAQGHGPNRPLEYCPVTGRWFRKKTTAAHIIPSAYGSDTMKTLFGEDAGHEMDSPLNIMPMCDDMEQAFDQHHWCFIPEVKDRTDEEQMRKWHESEPKEYRVHVFEPEKRREPVVDRGHDYDGSPELVVGDFHNEKVKFRNSYRPRARYLYFHACCAFIKQYRRRAPDINKVKITMNEVYWGTVGDFFKRSTLAGFSEVLHHKYRHLFLPTDPADFSDVDEYDAKSSAFDAAAVIYDCAANRPLRHEPVPDWFGDDEREEERQEEQREEQREEQQEEQQEEEDAPAAAQATQPMAAQATQAQLAHLPEPEPPLSAAVQSLEAVLLTTSAANRWPQHSRVQEPRNPFKGILNRTRRAFSG